MFSYVSHVFKNPNYSLKDLPKNISSGIVLPLKVVSACIILFCIFVGIRYIPNGISEKDYLKAGAGMVLLLFPFFFLHHILVLKHFKLEENKIIIRDLFHTGKHSFSEFISIRKINFCMYELENTSEKKVCTIHFSLSKQEFGRIKELMGLKEKG